jgi:hypothetical protein
MYLECRFTNTITTPNCDCVQILADAKPGVDAIPANTHANHKHLPDEFEMFTASLRPAFAVLSTIHTTPYTVAVPQGISADIFRPPVL